MIGSVETIGEELILPSALTAIFAFTLTSHPPPPVTSDSDSDIQQQPVKL